MKSTILFICLAAALGLFAAAESKSDEQGKDEAPPNPELSDQFVGNKLGQVRDDNRLKMKFVWCPPGAVTMENVQPVAEAENDDEPNDDKVNRKDKAAREPQLTKKLTAVKAFLTNGYWLGKYEVTQSEWREVMETEPWKGEGLTKEGADFPAMCVRWGEAIDFCRKLTEAERQAGRLSNESEYTLPTEAQWERACRARTETLFSFGDDASELDDYGWYLINTRNEGEPYAHRVGQKKPNPWGLYDMHGNVFEWCRDVYSEKLPGGQDPEVKSDEKPGVASRVLRSSVWLSGPNNCRSAARASSSPDVRHYGIGFRVALCIIR